ncbi:hypothetical protein, partial [Nonomuraea basaltis]|uniref:hypothetical protein n=1 Tax=Nonomuraea basaltis TaxID=2495887 RepID=UPI001485F958
MLPTTYVFLDKLPLTPHGKVDRQALPAPDTVLDNGRARREHRPTGPGRAVAGMGDDEVDALLNSLLRGAQE